ncbi:MAG TPA: hypothetical protein VJH97_04615 [Candidatus Nanoarchaeia archaeon]|nr:hypothetical protein [Candidatus Nanoarchaeia archaeon]
MEEKICPYCENVFTRIDYPQNFHRMVTCGSVECMGIRRRQLWQQRKNQLAAAYIVDRLR